MACHIPRLRAARSVRRLAVALAGCSVWRTDGARAQSQRFLGSAHHPSRAGSHCRHLFATDIGGLERTLQDLHGVKPLGLPDARNWIDHGKWPSPPPSLKKGAGRPDATYAFKAAEGDGLHQIAVGPVHAGIIEPGHFRFTVNGEAVVRLEERLGYAHKGIEALCRGADIAT